MANDKPDSESRVKPTKFGPQVFDYSECEFISLETRPLPDDIQHMIFRAFHSFGPDKLIMKERWQEPIPGNKVEADVFPHTPGHDICCADLAAFVLYQTGQLDHATAPHKRLWDNGKGWSFPKAAYWLPGPHNEAWVTCVKRGNKVSDFFVPKKEGDETSNRYTPIDEWLPGDYMLYCNDKADPKTAHPGHINVYIGPFQEIRPDQGNALVPRIYHLINASIGETGGDAIVRPKQLDNLAEGYLAAGKTIWHCRVHAIAALFNDVVGWPVRLNKPAPPKVEAKEEPKKDETKEEKPGGKEGKEGKGGKAGKKKGEGGKAKSAAAPPDPEAQARAKEAMITQLWDDTLKAETSYPLGRNLSWHDGVHLHLGEHLQNDEVLALGPGQLALARMGQSTVAGDTSFVLLEHWIDPVTRKILSTPSPVRSAASKSPAEDQRKKLLKDRARRFYTLYMHLAPLSTYMDKDGKTLKKDAPTWVSRLWPLPVPPPREMIPGTTPIRALVTWTKGHKAIALQPSANFNAGHESEKSACLKVNVGGTAMLALPHQVLKSNAESWTGAAPMAAIPPGRKLCLYNPLDHSILPLEVPLTPEMGLAAARSGALTVRKKADDGGVYVEIRAFSRPGYEGGSKEVEITDHHTVRLSSAKAKLYLDTIGEGESARFARTGGVKLSASPEAPIEVGIRSQSVAGKSRVAERIWVDLVPCVLLTADEHKQKEAKLKEDVDLAIDVNGRLEKRQSCLFGVKVGAHDEWIVDERGLLVPNKALLAKLAPDKQLLTLYPEVKGKGNQRSFGSPGKGVHLDSDSPYLFKVQATDDVAVTAIESFEAGHRSYALIEVMFAVPESAAETSTEEKEHVEKVNEKNKAQLDKLRKGEVLSFLDLADEQRNVPAGKIGSIGKAGPTGVRSFHFEVFSGENLIDKDAKGTADKITDVPRSRWMVYKDGKNEHFTPGQIRRFLKALDELPEKHRIDTRPLAGVVGPEGVLKPEEWIDFGRKNMHRLSQIITVHKSEWAVAWDEVRKAKDTRGQSFGDYLHSLTSAGKRETKEKKDDEAREKEAKALLDAFRWWGDDVKLPGIPDKEAVFFYHPLRFIEWLRTGFEITVAGIAAPKEAVLKVTLDGQEFPLELDEISGAYSFRTVLGEVAQGRAAKITLEKGVDTEVKEIEPVRLRRGQVTPVQLTNPTLSVGVERDIHGIGYAVEVSQKDVDDIDEPIWLLADGNLRLTEAGYSRATLRADLTYNRLPPTKVKVELEGEGFRIVAYSVTGVEVDDSGDGKLINEGKAKKGAKHKEEAKPPADAKAADKAKAEDKPKEGEEEMEEFLSAGEKPVPRKKGITTTEEGEVHLPASEPKRSLEFGFKVPPPRVSIERSGKVSVYCHLQVSEADIGEKGFGEATKIKFKVSTEGGDLGKRTAESARVATREISRPSAKSSPHGADIAKLQLYLAQIYAADHLPCYRPAGSHEETVANEPGKKGKKKITVRDEYDEKHRTVTVDGRYGGELAKGLWRFLYSFAGKEAGKEGFKLGVVNFIDDAGKKGSVTREELAAVEVEKLLDGHLPSMTALEKAAPGELPSSNEAMVRRFIERVNHPSEHPVVDGALLAEIVRRFHTPLVLPMIRFLVEMPKLGERYPNVITTADFGKNWVTNSSLLPAGDHIFVNLECPKLAAGKGDVEVEMSFPEGSSYMFADSNARTLSGSLHVMAKATNRHRIVPSGEVGDAADKHLLSIRVKKDGRLINSLQLSGVPDLRLAQPNATRAAAMLQIYLAAIPESPDKPEGPKCYQGAQKVKGKPDHALINGKWEKGALAALERFKKGYGGGDDYKALVEAIEKAYGGGPPSLAPPGEEGKLSAPELPDESA
ncbi:MAG: hypothetical protein ABI193_16465 [Minicystis sp.]